MPVPMLQIAMDYIALAPALAMAVKVAPEVDIIEIGTPLCKAVGLDAIRAMRELVGPDKLILADFKSPDVGGLEAKMAFDAGADMMTVIGGAALATVGSALAVAKEEKKEMLMELTGVRDILARAREWRQIGVERMVYHRGWDEQAFSRQWVEEDRTVIRQLIDMGFKVTVTGGITKPLLAFFQSLPVSVVICGRGIRETPDPTFVTKRAPQRRRGASRCMRPVTRSLKACRRAGRTSSFTPSCSAPTCRPTRGPGSMAWAPGIARHTSCARSMRVWCTATSTTSTG